MNKKVLNHFKSMPKDNVKSIFNKALVCLYAIEFFFVVAIYMALKVWTSQLWAELWMLLVFGHLLKTNFDLIEKPLLKKILERTGHGEKDEEKPEEALAEDSTKD